MPPCLPGELTDKIISLVPNGSEHSDHNTLLNCALVCQEWLPASRMALLHYIRLDSKAAYDSFVQHVLRSERIAHCLDSTHVLWIHEPPGVVESGNRGLPWSQRFIHDFAGHFLNLQKLSVWNVDWCALPPHPSIHIAISRFASLQQLDLHSCRLPSWHTVRRLLAALSPSLRSLIMWDVTCPASPHDPPALIYPTASAPSLTAFDFKCHWGDGDCFIPLLRWLSHTTTRHSLRHLIFVRPDDRLSSGYMAFLMAMAPVLTNLDVGLSVTSLCDVPFSELRSLQVLELGLTWSKASYWNDLSRLLPEIPSQLHAVAFSMFIARGELDKEADELLSETPIENHEMELLDDVLQGDNFQNLGRVEFRLFDRGYSDTTQCAEVEACVLEMVKRKLPHLVSRGILKIRSI